MADVQLYDLGPSPNNIKVRIALNFKGIAFDKIAVLPGDTERTEIIAVSGQPLTPVLKHGDSVIFDSGAILRYIDATFPAAPRLFFADRERMREGEALEQWVLTTLSAPVVTAFNEYQSGNPDRAVLEGATALLQEATGELEARLEKSAFLMGDAMSFVDVIAAPAMFYGMVPESMTAIHPVIKFLHDHLSLGDGRDRTRDWCLRVMAYDR